MYRIVNEENRFWQVRTRTNADICMPRGTTLPNNYTGSTGPIQQTPGTQKGGIKENKNETSNRTFPFLYTEKIAAVYNT